MTFLYPHDRGEKSILRKLNYQAEYYKLVTNIIMSSITGTKRNTSIPMKDRVTSMTPNIINDEESSESEDEARPDKHRTLKRVFSEEDLKARITTWKEGAEQRPVRILICGNGGTGKSTLLNQLMKFEKSEAKAKEGRRGRATTTIVEKFEKTTERGLKVCIFDTPGFDDMKTTNEEIIAMVENETESKLDLAFYCISLGGSTRVTQGDVRAMTLLTQIFSNQIWERTVVVLTFANHLERDVSEEDYKETITEIKKGSTRSADNC